MSSVAEINAYMLDGYTSEIPRTCTSVRARDRQTALGDKMKLSLRHLRLVRLQMNKDTGVSQGSLGSVGFPELQDSTYCSRREYLLHIGVERYGKRGLHHYSPVLCRLWL